jgi:hypothetical protein
MALGGRGKEQKSALFSPLGPHQAELGSPYMNPKKQIQRIEINVVIRTRKPKVMIPLKSI